MVPVCAVCVNIFYVFIYKLYFYLYSFLTPFHLCLFRFPFFVFRMQKLLFPVTLFARKVRLSLNPIISDANPHVKADIRNRNRQILLFHFSDHKQCHQKLFIRIKPKTDPVSVTASGACWKNTPCRYQKRGLSFDLYALCSRFDFFSAGRSAR